MPTLVLEDSTLQSGVEPTGSTAQRFVVPDNLVGTTFDQSGRTITLESSTLESGVEASNFTTPTGFPITPRSLIEATTRLTPAFNLGHLTSGMSNGFNSMAPVVSSLLPDPSNPNIVGMMDAGVRFLVDRYQIARNLQHTADALLQPLVNTFGNDLVVYMAFMNPLAIGLDGIGDKLSKHFTGEAVNIYLRPDIDNMFLSAERILDVVRGQVTHAVLNFNNSSWLHLVTNGPFSFLRGNIGNPNIMTIDHVLGQMAAGFFPFRSIARNPWIRPDFAPMRRLARFIPKA